MVTQLIFIFLFLLPIISAADIYKAVDSNGDIYYTDKPREPFIFETVDSDGTKHLKIKPKDAKFKRIIRTTSLLDASKNKVANTQSKEEGNKNVQGSFGSFRTVAETAKNKLGCPKSVDSDITPASFEGDGALYGCILGKSETVKWFINENPASKSVSSVKFLWNDWFKDMGYGLHSDKQEAQKALKVLIELYAPEKAKELNKLFFGNTNKTITSGKFTIKYTYDRGPAIDERMIVVTENEAVQQVTKPDIEIKPIPKPTSDTTSSVKYTSKDSALKSAIQAFGYRCDTVDLDSIIPFTWSGKSGYHIYCNSYQYGYEVEDVGGRIVVTVK